MKKLLLSAIVILGMASCEKENLIENKCLCSDVEQTFINGVLQDTKYISSYSLKFKDNDTLKIITRDGYILRFMKCN